MSRQKKKKGRRLERAKEKELQVRNKRNGTKEKPQTETRKDETQKTRCQNNQTR